MKKEVKQIVTRMAPSPTGRFHVGGIRTAFYSYAFARNHGGKFILRIEDTDKERNKKEYEDEIYEVFKWIGMDYDEVYRQSENLARHREILKQLIDAGNAYEAEEAKDGSGNIVRFKNPNKTITVQDEILGDVTVDTTDLGDFVIARNMESPLFHLAVIVDDHDEGVTHVIRAQEHLANTPRQILLHEALGFETPIYAHVPFILGPDGKKKLSKRDANVAALDYREMGYLPEALLNFLVFIGWNPGTEQEIFTKEELIQTFSLEQVQKGPAGYNVQKLDWINKAWLNKLSLEDFVTYIKDTAQVLWSQSEDMFQKLIPMIRERINKSADLTEMIDTGEFDYFFHHPEYLEPEKIIWKKSDAEQTCKHLAYLAGQFSSIDIKQWNSETVKSYLWDYAEEQGKGDVLWPLRYALSGKDKSPDPLTLVEILGKETTLQRVENALKKVKELV